MGIIILVVFIIFFVVYLNSGDKKAHKQMICNKNHIHLKPSVRQSLGYKGCVDSVHETEQDTQTRGVVPSMNQPNHIANFWKSDQSQTSDGSDCDKQSTLDFYRCSKNNAVNQDTKDVSNMHLTSRFATLKSA